MLQVSADVLSELEYRFGVVFADLNGNIAAETVQAASYGELGSIGVMTLSKSRTCIDRFVLNVRMNDAERKSLCTFASRVENSTWALIMLW